MLQNIHNIYRFTVTFPAYGDIEVKPANSTLEWIWEPVEDIFYYRKTLKTQLVFINDKSKDLSDFDKFYEHDRSRDKCEVLPIRIEKKCADAWQVTYTGELYIVDGDFDVDKCTLKIIPRTLDLWTCYEKRKDTEINLFDKIRDRKTLTWLLARIERKTCYSAWNLNHGLNIPSGLNASCLNGTPLDGDWQPERHEWAFFVNGGVEHIYTTWIREIYEGGNQYGPPSGTGWTDRGNGVYTREIPTRLINSEVYDDFVLGSGGSIPNIVHVDTYEYIFPEAGIDNGLRFNTVIKEILGQCRHTVRSDFYGVNPDNTAPDNEPYQNALEDCKRLYAYQITDIKLIEASNNATNFPFTLNQLLNSVRVTHNVYAGIDVNGNIRLEHITYWLRVYRQDLTKPELLPYLRGTHSYKYEKDDLPKKEVWKWMEETTDRDFKGMPVNYGTCYNSDKPDEKEHKANYLVTDIVHLRRNIEAYPDEGMVLIAATENGLVSRTDCLISSTNKLNGSLSFGNLLYRYHRWYRPQRMGNMNGTDEEFYLLLPTRNQKEIILPLCCEDLDAFNPTEWIKTQLGWGRVAKATLKDPGGKLTLETKHLS